MQESSPKPLVFSVEEDLPAELFTEQLPVIGRVSMLFYLPNPLLADSLSRLKDLIREQGGELTFNHECFTF